MKKNIKNYHPGVGWKHLYGSVWEHSNGIRVHVMGLVRMPDQTFINANHFPDSIEANMFIRINGGNKKRGLMSWALSREKKISLLL